LTEDNKPSSKTEPTLEELSARVKEARQAIEPKKDGGINETHAYGMAMRLVVELVSGLVVGLIIGWLLDKALDTKPLLMIIFVFLGLGAGIFNVMRAARQIEDAQTRKREEAERLKSKEG